MKKLIAILVIVSFVGVGCTGSFNLTKKVYNAHRSQSDKWADELLFLVCVLVPVYGIATFADAIVFNSIEFWTGENPVTVSSVINQGDEQAKVSYNKETDQVMITAKDKAGKEQTLVLERKDGMVFAKDLEGNVLYTSVENQSGDITIYDKDVKLVKNISAKDVKQMKDKYLE